MTLPAGGFTPEHLLEQLASLPETTRYWVGFSGGADSTALLDALLEVRAELNVEIRAIHFNHGLQKAADSWQQHCTSFCEKKGVGLEVHALQIDAGEKNSPETQARAARYAVLEQILEKDEIYLTAHQANDQAETLLLHMLRGSGLDGLAGIPALRKLGRGWVARPLLASHRQDLEEYLIRRNIPWITDPSNKELTADRNFLRNQVFPLLESRWSGTSRRLAQSAQLAADARKLLSNLVMKSYSHWLEDPIIMPAGPLLDLDRPFQALILRQWLRHHGAGTPPRARLQEFLDQLQCVDSASSQVEIRWDDWMIKRYDISLWLQQAPIPSPCPANTWSGEPSVYLGTTHGSIEFTFACPELPGRWEIGPRRPGAAMAVRRGGPRKNAKDLLRACGIPPWLRQAVPMIYRNDELQAVGDWLPGPEFASWLSEIGLSYRWQPEHPLLRKLQSVSVHCLSTSEFKNEQIQG